MIRDPSDGSVKPEVGIPTSTKPRPTSSDNWGLTSLNRDPKPSTFKPMTPEQLAEHYRVYTIGRKPKERTDDDR